MHVFKDTVRLPNGADASREYMRHVGAVCVVPLLDDGSVLLERQFRYPWDRSDRHPGRKARQQGRRPAGGREARAVRGDRRGRGELIELGLFFPACAYSDEAIHMYAAKNITFREQKLDEDEFLNVFTMPLEDAVSEVLSGNIPDAKTRRRCSRSGYCASRGNCKFISVPSGAGCIIRPRERGCKSPRVGHCEAGFFG